MAPRETENNAYGKFWGDKQRALWYVIVFSGMVNWRVTYRIFTLLDGELFAAPGEAQFSLFLVQ